MVNKLVRFGVLMVLCAACVGFGLNMQWAAASGSTPARPVLVAIATPKAKSTVAVSLSPATTDDKKAIQDTFAKYVAALKAKDSATAMALIDSKSIAWYQGALDAALNANRTKLKALSLLQRLVALRLRNEFPKNELEAMTGESVYKYGVQVGWIDSNSVSAFKIATIKITGNQAQASLQQAPQIYLLAFSKESGRWKLSFAKLLTLLEPEVKKIIRTSGSAEDDFIKSVIEASASNVFDKAIFDGPLDAVTPIEKPSGDTLTLQDSDKTVSITLLKDWRSVNNLNESAIVQAANGKEEKYLLIIRDSKEIVDDLDAYAKVILDRLPDRAKDVTVGSPVKLKINGLPAIQYKVDGTVGGLAITFLFTFVEGDSHYYQIMQWTLTRLYATHQKELKDIAQTIREL